MTRLSTDQTASRSAGPRINPEFDTSLSASGSGRTKAVAGPPTPRAAGWTSLPASTAIKLQSSATADLASAREITSQR